jgi:hypothetical protein
MPSPIDLEYQDHTFLKLLIERPRAMSGTLKVEINSKLTIVYFKNIQEVQFFFTNKTLADDNSLKLDILQAAKYKINSGDVSKENLTSFACQTLLPLLWSITIQTLTTNLNNFGIENAKFPLRENFDFNLDDVKFSEIDSVDQSSEVEN